MWFNNNASKHKIFSGDILKSGCHVQRIFIHNNACNELFDFEIYLFI